MRFEALSLPGPMLVRPDRHGDARGSFARVFCEVEFAAAGLPTRFPQANTSFNAAAGTLRGLHYQAPPHAEGKLVRCLAGAAFDVAVDLRAASATRGRFVSVTLTAEDGTAIWIPPGFAHGFQALQDRTELMYFMTESYHPELARGLRWDDPALGIDWPIPRPILSERDAALPGLDSAPPAD